MVCKSNDLEKDLRFVIVYCYSTISHCSRVSKRKDSNHAFISSRRAESINLKGPNGHLSKMQQVLMLKILKRHVNKVQEL